jgi:hypothetical protein
LILCDPSLLVVPNKDEALREKLDSILHTVSQLLSKNSDVIIQTYFTHIQPITQLNNTAPDIEI